MPQIWGNSPTFETGQVMSATAHLNALARNILLVKDDLQGVQPMSVGPYGGNYSGWLLHFGDLLLYSYYILGDDDQTVALYINGTLVPGASWTGHGAHSGSTNISFLSLVTGRPYYVYTGCSNASKLIVYGLREKLNSSFPTLAAFTDESTPTAAQWQALSTYADTLAEELSTPYGLFPRVDTRWSSPWENAGSIVHRAKYLRVSTALRCPSMEDEDSGHKFTRLGIWINDTYYSEFTNGDEAPGPAPVYSHNVDEGEYIWDEYEDLTAAGLTYGESYNVRVLMTAEGGFGYSTSKYGKVFFLNETPGAEAPDDPAGWQAVPNWEHGDYVKSSGAKDVGHLKANLEVLGGLLDNHGATFCRSGLISPGSDWIYSGTRRWRWLIYKNSIDPDDPAKEIAANIGYNYHDETAEVRLPETLGYNLGSYDLDSVQGLFPGEFYTVGGVQFAFEWIAPAVPIAT